MGDFWGDINAAKKDKTNKNLEIENEIVGSIREHINSDEFEEWLKSKIISNIRRNKHQTEIEVAFWDHSAGCSETNFHIGPYSWNNGHGGYDSRQYKGMYLYEIKREVVSELRHVLERRLDGLKVDYYSTDDTRSHLDYPKFIYTIRF